MSAVRPKKRTAAAADRLINRELSFLDYDARVLALVEDPELPLLERVFFCSVFSQMLDEFFAVRVVAVSEQATAGVTVRSPDGRTPLQTLSEARQRVLELQAEQARIWSEELVPALAAEGIVISKVEDLSPEERQELERRYERDIYPVLTPLAVGPGQPFPYISGLSISLAVFVRDPETGEERFARVKVPEGLPRFLSIGESGRFIRLERVITHFLPTLFPGMDVLERSVFRVTRDADSDVSDEADDLLEAVELELRRRRFGEVTRVEVTSSMSTAMRERIQTGLRVEDDLIYPVEGTLDLADVSELTKLDRPDLKVDTWIPVGRPPLAQLENGEQFAALRNSDILVHHPYDSFAASFEAFLDTAATDPKVIALKSTVYRTSDDTPLVPALIAAAENGKQSVCLVELKARGDERRNIDWSRALEQAGVHVVYGFPSMKTHAKTTLVVRREGGVLRRYAHIGTGNYNSVNAKTYEDFGLFTADEEISADIADLFNYLTGFGRPAHFRKLLVAPFTLRQRLVEEIRSVADAAREGRKARIRFKVNGLTHVEIIDELYAASEAGARIDLIVRGVCTLRPGVPGLSDGIRVRSVLGRFLEHSRLFHFETGDASRFYLGSADLMPRNLDHRVEVVVPIEDIGAQNELAATIDSLLADTASSWELDDAGVWHRIRPKKEDRPRSAQAVLMRRARRRVSLARSR
ncbi:MAG TPA: polyphosphate kinase 1 [Gaiellaceae bacterium]|jgi:polyphosphate kinase|nr:polyphosphate kinase 1 [Gaiellaceae bacterium]